MALKALRPVRAWATRCNCASGTSKTNTGVESGVATFEIVVIFFQYDNSIAPHTAALGEFCAPKLAQQSSVFGVEKLGLSYAN